MYCPNCGKEATPGAKFCAACGGRLNAPEPGAAEAPATPEIVAASSKQPPVEPTPQGEAFFEATTKQSRKQLKLPNFKSRGAIITYVASGVAVLLLIAGSFVPGLYKPLTESQMPALAKAVGSSQLNENLTAVCDGITAAMPSQDTLDTYAAREAQIAAVGSNARAMLKFYNRTDWLTTSSEAVALESTYRDVSDEGLTTLAKTYNAMGINDKNRDLLAKVWRDDYLAALNTDCPAASSFEVTRATLSEYDMTVNDAVSLADSAPWYPVGYNESPDDSNLAWKWVSAYSDCYSCSYWHVKVIAKDSCPTGLYAEINILNGGSVVDWTNDTVPYLGAGETAILEFDTYSSSAESGRLTQLHCD